MNSETSWFLIASGSVLAVLGIAMVRASSLQAQPCRGRAVRPCASPARTLARCSILCGVITAGQWAVLSHTEPGAAWALTLWLPAFLAAATVTRLLAVLRAIGAQRRRTRAAEGGGNR